MRKYRIVTQNSETFWIQKRFLFFFWVDVKEADTSLPLYSLPVRLICYNCEQARNWILNKLKEEAEENKPVRVVG